MINVTAAQDPAALFMAAEHLRDKANMISAYEYLMKMARKMEVKREKHS